MKSITFNNYLAKVINIEKGQEVEDGMSLRAEAVIQDQRGVIQEVVAGDAAIVLRELYRRYSMFPSISLFACDEMVEALN